ncbi:VPLPA-CTERM sorting domain-containing protein [Roseobacter sp. S98]|uniref:VPLPA-CTERM sorting domain-containing protein n=1 Tax=Roseobacter algicola (ex Choi et al. 2025) (nom. illeg.) TaxID=3092138 RepID=UPI0035C783D1
MTNLFKAVLLVAGLTFGAAAQAATIDPYGPDRGFFSWSGGNPDVRFRWTPTLDITVDEASVFTFTARDGYVVGDEFGLIVDGQDVAWDTTSILPEGYFSGSARIALDPGTTRLDLRVSRFAPGFTGGGAFWSSSAVEALPSPVPLPAGMPLLIAGVGVFGFLRYRRKA